MSDVVLVAVIAATPPTIGAMAAVVVGIMNNRKAEDLRRKSDGIHELVNSQLTAVKSELVMAQQKIVELQAFIIQHHRILP